MTKCCSLCKKDKEFDEFHNLKSSKDGKKPACKLCAKNRPYNDKKIAVKRAQKRYRLKKDEVLAYGRQHKADNVDRYKEIARKGAYRRRHNNLSTRIKHNINSELGIVLKKQNATKKSRIIQLLGCSIEELRNHLTSLFKDGMSWDNYGKRGWEIDHIRPCASFNLTDPEQQKECFHYTNLQPLWGKENGSKGSLFNNKRYKHAYNIN